jgi:hypothetical protein
LISQDDGNKNSGLLQCSFGVDAGKIILEMGRINIKITPALQYDDICK